MIELVLFDLGGVPSRTGCWGPCPGALDVLDDGDAPPG